MHDQTQWIVLAVAGVIALAFCALLYLAARSWRKIATWKWMTGLLLLIPHFLLLWFFAVSLLNGNAPRGSDGWNAAFAANAYIVFILPVPVLLGSIGALLVFRLSRRVNSPVATAPPSEHPTLRP
jgi:4-amino-4-deoxy-L-arabinose transferase-like glycosyltransferase